MAVNSLELQVDGLRAREEGGVEARKWGGKHRAAAVRTWLVNSIE